MGLQSETLIITGGRPLNGLIKIGGAKNSKALIAATLAGGEFIFRNVPKVSDTEVTIGLIEAYGGSVLKTNWDLRYRITSKLSSIPNNETLLKYASQSRFPILFLGPLLGRFGEAAIPNLGGCKIGKRPVDFHLQILQQMGAKVEEDGDILRMSAKSGLKGANICLPYPSVGATEQAILAAALAKGTTRIVNAAIEPEVIDLANLIQKMGGIVFTDTDRTITIEGVKSLKAVDHTLIPDRIEAASWASASLATGGVIFLEGARQDHLSTFLNYYRKIGGEFSVDNGKGICFFKKRVELNKINIQTDVYPGFSTDWMQPLVIPLTVAGGLSTIHETVYDDRLRFTNALNQMGAKIELYKECLGTLPERPCRFKDRDFWHSAIVAGPSRLHGADIEVPDLRGGFSYVLAALVAEGQTTLRNAHILERGYPNFVEKLKAVGADVRVVN